MNKISYLSFLAHGQDVLQRLIYPKDLGQAEKSTLDFRARFKRFPKY
jgi:hypothetical protein